MKKLTFCFYKHQASVQTLEIGVTLLGSRVAQASLGWLAASCRKGCLAEPGAGGCREPRNVLQCLSTIREGTWKTLWGFRRLIFWRLGIVEESKTDPPGVERGSLSTDAWQYRALPWLRELTEHAGIFIEYYLPFLFQWGSFPDGSVFFIWMEDLQFFVVLSIRNVSTEHKVISVWCLVLFLTLFEFFKEYCLHCGSARCFSQSLCGCSSVTWLIYT